MKYCFILKKKATWKRGRNLMDQLLRHCITLAKQAGKAVMEVYDSGDFEVETKADNTPLTKADKIANEIIVDGLKKYSGYPIISEEGAQDAEVGNTFWLVDPIDGTKDFIKRTGEFTINIGLIQDGKPVLGVVYVPAQKVTYFGAVEAGAFKQEGDHEPVRMTAEFTGSVPVVVSHNKMEDELKEYLSRIGEYTMMEVGSSIKFCLVAEGTAAVYPRFYGSYLWDTAAADAILRAAGGMITDDKGQELTYDPEHSLQNPYLIASAKNWHPEAASR